MNAIAAAAQALLNAVQAAAGASAPSPGPSFSSLASHAGPTVADAVNEALLAKARAGRRRSYLSKFHGHLVRFAQGREGRPLGTVTAREIEDWLHSQGWSPRSLRGLLIDVRTVFSLGIRRG